MLSEKSKGCFSLLSLGEEGKEWRGHEGKCDLFFPFLSLLPFLFVGMRVVVVAVIEIAIVS